MPDVAVSKATLMVIVSSRITILQLRGEYVSLVSYEILMHSLSGRTGQAAAVPIALGTEDSVPFAKLHHRDFAHTFKPGARVS